MFLTNLLCSKFLSLIWISSLLWLYSTNPEFIIWWTCLCGCNTWFGDDYLILCLFLTKFLLQQELKLISYLSRYFYCSCLPWVIDKVVRMWLFAMDIFMSLTIFFATRKCIDKFILILDLSFVNILARLFMITLLDEIVLNWTFIMSLTSVYVQQEINQIVLFLFFICD